MHNSTPRVRRRITAAFTALVTLTASVVLALAPTSAAIAGEPSTQTPETATVDALPTWQINGVVWSQAVVGNTVYVTGSFTKARPPGVAAGGPGEIAAKNVFAYDIRTGNPIPNFSPSFDAQGLVVRAAPDGETVYFGGDFTVVDGQPRAHVAAFDVATGALLDWAPSTDGQVRAFGFIGDTVYAGGNFRSSNGVPRTQLAAWDAKTGEITSWAPTATGNGFVWDMVVSPDNSRIIVGGGFTELNATAAYGMGALDAEDGSVLPWAASQRIRTAGTYGAISSLSTDGEQVYGTGYANGNGATFEGSFAADPNTGNINWVNDCLGDTYSSFPQGDVLYTTSHRHNCGNAGAFPDTETGDTRAKWMNATAERTFPIGTIENKNAYGWDFRGLNYSGLLQWYPDLAFGTYTSSRQAAWTVSGNDEYVVLGGEFPRVNGVAQQGLVRFAKRGIAPAKVGPVYNAGLTPNATSDESGVVRVSFSGVWDRDNAQITYDVFRGDWKRVGTLTRDDSNFWKLSSLSVTDKGLTPGSQVRYQVRATDADGNTQWSEWSPTVTVSSEPLSNYRAAVRTDGAAHYWRLGETTGTRLADDVGNASGTASGVTLGATGAITGDRAVTSTSTSRITTAQLETPPAAVSVEAWVRTTSFRGGRIVGFGNSATGTSTSGQTDRALYLDSSGRPAFTINDGAYRAVYGRTSINDGQWHHVVGTVSSEGMQLYVDGVRVDRDQRYTQASKTPGYWRIGADQTAGFANRPIDAGLSGTIDDVAVYDTALSQQQVQSHFTASGRSGTWGQTPADPYGATVAGDAPDIFWRMSEPSGSGLADVAGTGVSGLLSGGYTRNVTGAIPGNSATRFGGTSGVAMAQQVWTSPSSYSAELWFRSTSTRGGLLMGFGNVLSGTSSVYDRQISLLSDGRVSFGTGTVTRTSATTPRAYNDGQWHQVVATQDSSGMKLWIDSTLVASSPVATAGEYRGVWRLGGDRTFGGTASNYVAADIDEVAVFSQALSEDRIRAHYAASGRTPANRPPVASFSVSADNLDIAVDASESTDPDDSVATYSWNFGDGTTATGKTAQHTYAAGGTYTVTVTVADSQGLSATTTREVTVAPNKAPTAAFESAIENLTLSVDAAGSGDSDGEITDWAWEFGDGTTATGETAEHSYAEPGTYTVTLTVTDDDDATSSTTETVTAVEPPNEAPTARFTTGSDGLAVTVDAAASTDSDGDLTQWAWDFGDGTTASGQTASHTYTADGTYTVKLTVTDDGGANATTSTEVTVAAPRVWAVEDFARALTGGWGTATTGGEWAYFPADIGTRSKFAIADGTGRVTLAPAQSATAFLPNSRASTDTDLSFSVSFDKAASGGGFYFSAIGRQIELGTDYRAKYRVSSTGAVAIWLTRTVGGVETVLPSITVPGLTLAAGQSLSVRVQVTGTAPTTIRAKAWLTGSTEPTNWTLTTTDSAEVLQKPGYVGINSYLSGSAAAPGVTYRYDDLWAGAPQ